MANIRDSINELIEDIELRRESGQQKKYDENISALVDDLYSSTTKGFDYDADTDPVYQAAVKDYTTEADRTMRDVLGQGAAKTGGIASTAAVAAASQARDYQMGQLADVKANAYNNALARSEAETAAKFQMLSALENMDDDDKGDYIQLLSMLEGMNETDREEARSQIQNMIALGMMPGEDLISASGWDKAYVQGLQDYRYNNMTTAEMQQYLNSQGAGIAVDGSWGPATEAAYQKIFGKSSGRQTASYTPAYTQTYTREYTPPVSDQIIDSGSNYDMAKQYLGTEGLNMTAKAKNEFINEAVKSGELSKEEANRLKKYIGNAR